MADTVETTGLWETAIATTEDTSMYERFYTFIAVFGGYLVAFFIGLGFFGNILSIVIFFRQRKRDSASAIYLGFLAVSDTGNLGSGLGFWVHQCLYYMSNYQINLPHSWSDISCKIAIYIWLNCTFISGWIIIIFSAERMIAVLFPLKVASLVTPTRRKVALACLFVTSITVWLIAMPIYKMYSPWPPGHHHRFICHFYEFELPTWIVVWFYSQVFSLVEILPCILISTLNLIIAIAIFTKGQDVKRNAVDQNRFKKEMRCLINLLFVSSAYVLLMLPFAVTWIYYMYQNLVGWPGRTAAFRDFMSEVAYFTNSIAMINYGINFIIYTISLYFYREEARKIFSSCFKQQNQV